MKFSTFLWQQSDNTAESVGKGEDSRTKVHKASSIGPRQGWETPFFLKKKTTHLFFGLFLKNPGFLLFF